MLAVTLVLTTIAKLNPVMFRIAQYYWIFMIIYIPNLIDCIYDKGLKSLFIYIFIALGIFFFYYKLQMYGIRMHPYVFYWNEYPVQIPGLY